MAKTYWKTRSQKADFLFACTYREAAFPDTDSDGEVRPPRLRSRKADHREMMNELESQRAQTSMTMPAYQTHRVEQEVARNVGTFARFSIADNRYEAFEFTDVDQSGSGGTVLGGALWGRSGDRIGIGLAAIGLGVMVFVSMRF